MLKSTLLKNIFSSLRKFLLNRTFSARKLFQKMSIFSPFPKFYFILILAHCDTSRSSFCLLVVVTKARSSSIHKKNTRFKINWVFFLYIKVSNCQIKVNFTFQKTKKNPTKNKWNSIVLAHNIYYFIWKFISIKKILTRTSHWKINLRISNKSLTRDYI